MSGLELMPGVTIHCDKPGCVEKPAWVPQVWVPEPGWISVDTTKHGIKKYLPLHFCDLHKAGFDLDALLTDAVKTSFEVLALAKWGSRELDFELAWTNWVRVRDPDYAAWLGNNWPSLVPAAREHIRQVTARRAPLRPERKKALFHV